MSTSHSNRKLVAEVGTDRQRRHTKTYLIFTRRPPSYGLYTGFIENRYRSQAMETLLLFGALGSAPQH